MYPNKPRLNTPQVSPLRLRRVWLLLGWCFVAGVIYLSLAPSLPSVAQHVWDKASHLVSYAWLMLWFAQLHDRLAGKALVALGLVGLGIALEWLQGLGGVRELELLDAFSNALGVGGGLLLSFTPLGAVLRRLETGTAAAR